VGSPGRERGNGRDGVGEGWKKKGGGGEWWGEKEYGKGRWGGTVQF